jgi:hypothetical protein
METWMTGGDSGQGRDDLFIAMECRSWTVWGGWTVAVVQIQCFGFSSREETTGRSIVGR